MSVTSVPTAFIKDIQKNCDISDARDHGIYTMCTMVLKLRNLYKWEKGLQPWEEPESADLLDWIEVKEKYWATIVDEPFRNLCIASKISPPFDLEVINDALKKVAVLYGAGFGRSMKAVFFLAEIVERRNLEGCPVVILGKERAREMAGPFAMVQDGLIIIRKEALRFFFWDQILEIRSTCRRPLQHALQPYGVLHNGTLDRELLKAALDTMVEQEMNLFIYHEIGEILQATFDSESLRTIVDHFPGTAIEFACRAVKDILADTHPQGLLAYIVREQRDSSLGLYLSLLDGLRQRLFPEISVGWERFLADGNWRHIEQARSSCWERNRQMAEQIKAISQAVGNDTDQQLIDRFNTLVLSPLGFEIPTAG